MAPQFLALPAEVRNTIYEQTFLHRQTSWPRETHKITAILSTCRQIYEEAKGLYYTSGSCTLTNTLAIAKRLCFPPAVLRIIASYVLEDRVASHQPGLSKFIFEVAGFDDCEDFHDQMLAMLDVELIRAYGKYTTGRRLGRYFWHNRLGLREPAERSRRK